MGDPEKALQIVAAVALQQLFDMPAVLRGLTSGQETAQIPVADGADLRQPLKLGKLRFIKGVALTGKAQYRLRLKVSS